MEETVTHEPSPDGLGHTVGVPIAGLGAIPALPTYLRALASDCESTDGWEDAAGDLQDAADEIELARELDHYRRGQLEANALAMARALDALASREPRRLSSAADLLMRERDRTIEALSDGAILVVSHRYAAQAGVTRMGGDAQTGSVAESDSTRSSQEDAPKPNPQGDNP